MSDAPEPLKAVRPDGWDEVVHVGKWVVRFPNGLLSANALSRPEDGKTTPYIRADLAAAKDARIADLERQLAEARDVRPVDYGLTLCECGMSGPCMWGECKHPFNLKGTP